MVALMGARLDQDVLEVRRLQDQLQHDSQQQQHQPVPPVAQQMPVDPAISSGAEATVDDM